MDAGLNVEVMQTHLGHVDISTMSLSAQLRLNLTVEQAKRVDIEL
ncbi:MAG: hypothetical protein QHI48_02060 [Bacteroidota bacterium]|nr:hypothetical protein [Bacteroidota bacterium]